MDLQILRNFYTKFDLKMEQKLDKNTPDNQTGRFQETS